MVEGGKKGEEKREGKRRKRERKRIKRIWKRTNYFRSERQEGMRKGGTIARYSDYGALPLGHI